MRAPDWSTSPLGSPDRWPQSLRTTVGLLLQSRFPMFVAWGSELAREIRLRHPTSPVVLTTGYVEAVADMKDGEFGLLMKPFSLEGLAEALGVAVP